jgi:hypothetical protein
VGGIPAGPGVAEVYSVERRTVRGALPQDHRCTETRRQHLMTMSNGDKDIDRRVRSNQQRLGADLKPSYDFIVCGAGASGSVMARRLAEDPSAAVPLPER